MKKIILGVLLLLFAGVAQAQHITIARQGHFSVGGQTIQRSGEYDNSKFVGWAEQEETGQSYRADHAFVDFQIPADSKKLPLVYVHGYGGSGVCWQMTPDGREGFATLMLRRGWSSYVVDLPGRGRAGRTSATTTPSLWPTKCSGSTSGVLAYGRITTRAYSSRKIRLLFRSSFAK